MQMNIRFCECEIEVLANGYLEYQSVHGPENHAREQKIMSLRDHIQQQGFLTKDDLHRVAYWKSPRKAYLTLENCDTWIKKITIQAFTETDHWKKLMILKNKLHGVRQPIASAILHHYDDEQYPILDIRALWSVGLEWKKRTYYRRSLWLEYIKFCRDIANRNGVEMRTLDRALWFYSRDHSYNRPKSSRTNYVN